MSYLYLVPIFMAFFIGLCCVVTSSLSEKRMIDKPFLNEISNELYILSYSKPFVWFINPDESHPKVRSINKMIVESNESNRLNYRVYATLQIVILILAIFATLIFSIIADNSILLFQLLFNIKIDVTDPTTMLMIKVGVGLLLMTSIIVPKIYLSTKAKKNNYTFLKDLPILQLFIILMLKAKRPLSEVIYVLSNTNTTYKSIFDRAYRMYVRDKNDGMQYLLNSFYETKFEETVMVLFEYGEYSKKDTMVILENGLKDITEYTNTLKRRTNIVGNVISQLSLALPFLSAMLLIFSPLISYGLSLMSY